jgi:hypothetical protein
MAASSWAYDFAAGGIYYNISSATNKTVAVTYNPSSYGSYSGAITIPSTVTYNSIQYTVDSIGNHAFSDCNNLTSISIPSSVTAIGDMAFSYCTSLTSITLPSKLTSIGNYLFYSCINLTSVTIPASLTTISSWTFVNCSGLTSISIPATVTSIEQGAFNSCTGLTDIYAYATTPVSLTSSPNTFTNVNTTTCVLHVPTNSVAAYQGADVWKNFTNIKGDVTSAVSNATASAVKVTVRNGQAVITGTEAGTALSVYNLQGTAIYSGKTSGETQSIALPNRGVYIVLLGGKCVKVIY